MKLLSPELLVKTGDVDHADWNYRPVLGWIQRLRFEQVVSLLADTKCHRLLEIGYGSGVFMPVLARYCEELYGIDIHNKHDQVRAALESYGITAKLHSGSAECLPFGDSFFDCIVAVSALEFIPDIEAASCELKRVLKQNGCIVVVMPAHSRIVDTGLWMLTGESASNDYGNRRERVIPTLLKHFECDKKSVRPRFLGRIIPLYIGLRLR
jgi:ubiquinone/menaquinone biosynthesis C-methylase UbiE